MPSAPKGSLRVEIPGPHHDCSSFASGVEPLDRYFRGQAGQDARKNMAAPLVLVLPGGAIGGYDTLSAAGVKFTDFPAAIMRKLPGIRAFRQCSSAGLLSTEPVCRSSISRTLVTRRCLKYGNGVGTGEKPISCRIDLSRETLSERNARR